MPVEAPLARVVGVTLATALIALAPRAHAEDAPAQAPSRELGRFGIGWMIGNGLGARGADVIVAPWRRLAFELQVSQVETTLDGEPPMEAAASGWGIAPVVRAYLWPDGALVPYGAAGAFVTWWTYRSLAWTSTGLFATAGVELRTPDLPRLRVLAGAGVGYSPAVEVSSGSERIWRDRRRGVNLELGVRCMFL